MIEPIGPETLPPPGEVRRPRVGTFIALFLIVAGIVSAIVINQRRIWTGERSQELAEAAPKRAEDLPDLGVVDDFALTERSGLPVTRKSLLGRVWVADYFFTFCSGPCQSMSLSMGKLHREFVGKDEPKFVSISSDPRRDTLEVLTDYARDHQADTDRWWFVTGDTKDLAALARSLQLPYESSDPTKHSMRFVLVDRQGHIRGSYVGTSGKDLDDLRRDLNLLLAAPPKG